MSEKALFVFLLVSIMGLFAGSLLKLDQSFSKGSNEWFANNLPDGFYEVKGNNGREERDIGAFDFVLTAKTN